MPPETGDQKTRLSASDLKPGDEIEMYVIASNEGWDWTPATVLAVDPLSVRWWDGGERAWTRGSRIPSTRRRPPERALHICRACGSKGTRLTQERHREVCRHADVVPADQVEEGFDYVADIIAAAFHDAYERLAPDHGYETREASRTTWGQVPENNRSLMRATVRQLLDAGLIHV